MTSRWQRIARATNGQDYATAYAAQFEKLNAGGQDIHGEAAFVAGLVAPPARVLDAGCGTGRIAIRLAEVGYRVVGVDVDAAMLAQARAQASQLDWRESDVAAMDLSQEFDLVLLAGNVIPLLEPETLRRVAERLAAHTAPGGSVVCGFGLDPAHLPGDCPVTPLVDVDQAFADAGLMPRRRWSTWQRDPFVDGGGYVVTVHERASA